MKTRIAGSAVILFLIIVIFRKRQYSEIILHISEHKEPSDYYAKEKRSVLHEHVVDWIQIKSVLHAEGISRIDAIDQLCDDFDKAFASCIVVWDIILILFTEASFAEIQNDGNT